MRVLIYINEDESMILDCIFVKQSHKFLYCHYEFVSGVGNKKLGCDVIRIDCRSNENARKLLSTGLRDGFLDLYGYNIA